MPEIDKNEVLRDALSGLNEDVPPMPEGLHAAWMQKVEDDMNETRTEKYLYENFTVSPEPSNSNTRVFTLTDIFYTSYSNIKLEVFVCLTSDKSLANTSDTASATLRAFSAS